MQSGIHKLVFDYIRRMTGWPEPAAPATEQLDILSTHPHGPGRMHVQFQYIRDEDSSADGDRRQVFTGWLLVAGEDDIEQSSMGLEYVGPGVRLRFNP